MPVNRGSLHKLAVIAETSYGATPATPTLVEIPIVDLNKTANPLMARSAQLRSHPFVDRLIGQGFSYDFVATTELQDGAHDILFQTMFGAAITAKAVKVTDNLSSLTGESQAGGSTPLFDVFGGIYFNKLDVTITAGATAPIRSVFTGKAKTGSLDNTATIATAVTAAPTLDPFVFADAGITVGGVTRPVTAMNFSLGRTVTEEWVLGARTFREAIPDAVTLTGQITIPFEDALESARFAGFVDAAIVARCASQDGTRFRQFAIPKTKYTKFGRQINSRGAILQVIDFEAYYDTASATVMTLTTE